MSWGYLLKCSSVEHTWVFVKSKKITGSCHHAPRNINDFTTLCDLKWDSNSQNSFYVGGGETLEEK